ncbi:hypothetical protein AURDEDRAFT_112648 [Auricularia subglabra TFB-10046 SS5]|nr:hypothetical protein AURDEDRAFT_112648 [Auricularia subglabra TFB-10046 SS5]
MRCSITDCRNRACRDAQGYCLLCERRLCRVHAQRPAHGCPSVFVEDEWEEFQQQTCSAQTREIAALVSKIDFYALSGAIAAMRPGVQAVIDPMFFGPSKRIKHDKLLMGGFNLHIPVSFSDGVSWLVRIPRQTIKSPRCAVSQGLLTSEVATLQYLRAAGLPVPEVFAVKKTDDNPVRTPYIVFERMPGEPMMWEQPSEDQRLRRIAQTAAHFVQLAACPVSALGYLRDASGRVGPVLDPDFVDTLASSQPFGTSREFHRAKINGILRDIVDGLRYTSRGLDAYLVHLQLLVIVDILYPEHEPGTAPFYIKHPDDKGDNHLVDDEGDIVSIIDWERTRSCSPQEAFVGPTFAIDIGTFYEGSNELSADESALVAALEAQGRVDLASYVRDGKKFQRLEFCVGAEFGDSGHWHLFRGLMTTCGIFDWGSWDAWREHALRPEVFGSVAEVQVLVKARTQVEKVIT